MTRPFTPKALRRRIIEQAGHPCGYCLSSEKITGIPIEIEHLYSVALGGLDLVGWQPPERNSCLPKFE